MFAEIVCEFIAASVAFIHTLAKHVANAYMLDVFAPNTNKAIGLGYTLTSIPVMSSNPVPILTLASNILGALW